VEGCAGRVVAVMPVALAPVALAFPSRKSARASTAGAIRARYHGSTRRVLFTASSVDLSQDARALRVKEKVIAIVSLCQSTDGAEQGMRQRKHAQLHLLLGVSWHARHYLRHVLGNAAPGLVQISVAGKTVSGVSAWVRGGGWTVLPQRQPDFGFGRVLFNPFNNLCPPEGRSPAHLDSSDSATSLNAQRRGRRTPPQARTIQMRSGGSASGMPTN
jgi:hypothetical protein